MSFALEVELLLVAVIGYNDRHKKRSPSVTTWLRPANLVRRSLARDLARNGSLSASCLHRPITAARGDRAVAGRPTLFRPYGTGCSHMPGPMRVDSGQSSDLTVGCIFSHVLIAGVLRQSPP
jgi:hypothetical protein